MFLLKIAENGWAEALLNWLVKADQNAFIFINRVFTTRFLDAVIPVWREAQTWYPLYLFLLLLAVVNFGRKALPWLLLFGITIAICDQVSSGILKDLIARPRPCGDPHFSQYVRLLLNRCPGSGSFTSSHATNHFGMATFMVHTLSVYLKKWKYGVYLWAASICYAQVYMGVHYPLDVIGGAILGYAIGWGTSAFFNSRWRLGVTEREHSLEG